MPAREGYFLHEPSFVAAWPTSCSDGVVCGEGRFQSGFNLDSIGAHVCLPLCNR
jgi:hypothetical protein